MKSVLAMLAGALALSGCAVTRITSQVNVTAPRVAYDTVLVVAAFDQLEMMKLGEREMQDRFSARKVVGLPSSEVFLPGNAYTEEQVQATLAERNVAAILVLAAAADGVKEIGEPPTYSTRGTGCFLETIREDEGYTQSVPWADFRAELIDVRTDERVWVATANPTATPTPRTTRCSGPSVGSS